MLVLCVVSEIISRTNSFKRTFVSINSDARVSSLVRARESYKTCWVLATTTDYLELMASRVELRSWIRVCGMQGDKLMTNEVISRRNALRDGVGYFAASLHERCGAPSVGGTRATVLLDFEPDRAGDGSVACVWEDE